VSLFELPIAENVLFPLISVNPPGCEPSHDISSLRCKGSRLHLSKEPQESELAVTEILKFSRCAGSLLGTALVFLVRRNELGRGRLACSRLHLQKSGTETFAKPPRHHGDELFIPVALDSVSKLQ
jgi:hypothetical protein